MILANSVVDTLEDAPAHGQGLGKYRVTVYGVAPHDYVRIYEIQARNDSIAAREGLDRFLEDITRLVEGKGI